MSKNKLPRSCRDYQASKWIEDLGLKLVRASNLGQDPATQVFTTQQHNMGQIRTLKALIRVEK